MPENQQEQQQQGPRPPEPKSLTLALETAIASVAGAAIGIGSALLLPREYSLPLALGAAIVVPKKNKGLSTAFVLVLSWLIMFTIFYQP